MKRILLLLIPFLLFASYLPAQILEPITWDITLQPAVNGTTSVRFVAKIEAGWHLYGLDLPEGGPISTSVNTTKLEGAQKEKVTTDIAPIRKYDQLFNMELSYFDKTVAFILPLTVTDTNRFAIAGELEYMACNDKNCLPPTTIEFSFTHQDLQNRASNGGSPSTLTTELRPTTEPLTTIEPQASTDPSTLWTPVIDELRAFGGNTVHSESSVWFIFIAGFVGGLIALLTPCVWPMIPMTVSFFLKRTKSRRKAVADAITYGVSIIFIYLILGLAITMIFGASALNDLSTNAIFNILFCLLLVVFAISFFGAFEITLPASWSNKMDARADSAGGLLSIFFMAFTLSLVSFSCTGPIIGTLLVQAATMGNILGPAVGMFGFALALAIPFALFAIFPSWLKQMPRSGGWLNSVKVVLGFLELALALKFLSVADLAYGWRILDREVFLVLWIVLFILLGFYLLGKLKFSHDSDLPHVSIPRFGMAIAAFAFALYMVPGLWGAPLKAISAFTPPLTTQDFSLYKDEVHAAYDDYDAGMAYAKGKGKPALVDFSGFGCVNCRKMEAAVWTDPKVKQILENDFVLITLFVDDKTPLPQPIPIVENGRERTLKTVGDKWSYLQRHKFGANAQPFYVMLDDKGKPLGPSYSFDESVEKFIAFLRSGLE